MECPVCKNRIGFNCGTCIECGYNYLSNKFEFIRVQVSDLEKYLPQDICYSLIEKHEKYKRVKILHVDIEGNNIGETISGSSKNL